LFFYHFSLRMSRQEKAKRRTSFAGHFLHIGRIFRKLFYDYRQVSAW
jgi:hypothetical protein